MARDMFLAEYERTIEERGGRYVLFWEMLHAKPYLGRVDLGVEPVIKGVYRRCGLVGPALVQRVSSPLALVEYLQRRFDNNRGMWEAATMIERDMGIVTAIMQQTVMRQWQVISGKLRLNGIIKGELPFSRINHQSNVTIRVLDLAEVALLDYFFYDVERQGNLGIILRSHNVMAKDKLHGVLSLVWGLSHLLSMIKAMSRTANLGLEVPEGVYIWHYLMRRCLFWYPLWNEVLVGDGPEYVRMDGDVIHCADGPAIKYSDGFEIYVYGGRFIADDEVWIIEDPERISVDDVNEQRNVELRRIMLAQMGLKRYLCQANAYMVDRDNKNNVTLWQTTLQGEPWQMVESVCPSTGRVYIEGVGDNIFETVQQAMNWQWSGLEYNPRKQS